MTQEDIRIAELLSYEGKRFTNEVSDRDGISFQQLPNSKFAIAAAISIMWAQYAKFDNEFVGYAADYIDGTGQKDILIIKHYTDRFGQAMLESVLWNYRIYYSHIKNQMPRFEDCGIPEIEKVQKIVISKLTKLKQDKQVSDIGAWLCIAPFKILLSHYKQYWQSTNIDSILLPTGLEVNEAIKKLVKKKITFFDGLDKSLLIDKNTFGDGITAYMIIQSYLQRISTVTASPVLHINSALYLYGRGEIR